MPFARRAARVVGCAAARGVACALLPALLELSLGRTRRSDILAGLWSVPLGLAAAVAASVQACYTVGVVRGDLAAFALPPLAARAALLGLALGGPFVLSMVVSGACRRRGVRLVRATLGSALPLVIFVASAVAASTRSDDSTREQVRALLLGVTVSGLIALHTTALVAFVDGLFGPVRALSPDPGRAAYWQEPAHPP